LSGGADSSAVAAIVGIMCHLVHTACCEGNTQVLSDVRRITALGDHYIPSSPSEVSQFSLSLSIFLFSIYFSSFSFFK
jgi:NAD+ synthase (glutamine-hydrolysing)